MKLTTTKKLIAIASIALFAQFSMADQASAQKTIVDILTGMSHFPSDDQKAELMAIADDEASGRGMQMIATAIGNIQHAATDEGKESMNQIIGRAEASASAKTIAEAVLGFNHMTSDDAKAALASL